MRNWPYAYAKSQEADSAVMGQFNVTALPTNNTIHAGTLGGWQIAVSQYSNHPEESIALVRYLSSKRVQQQRALEGSYLPTIASLYNEETIISRNPFIAELKDVFANAAVARPSNITKEHYNDVSVAYFTAVHNTLTKKVDAQTALSNLEMELGKLLAP